MSQQIKFVKENLVISVLSLLVLIAIGIILAPLFFANSAKLGNQVPAALAPNVTCTLYASPSGSGNCSSGSPCSLDTANSQASAGSTVCLLAGTYNRSSTFYPHGGNSGAYVTYSGGINGEAILYWTGGQGNVVNTNGANYVTLQNFTVNGAGRNYYTGVGLDNSHHVTARGLYVLNAGEAGIYDLNSDYVTIDHNLVFHNGYNGYGWSSGIGMNRPSHFDRNAGFHYFITNNIISGEYDGSNNHTDGNGIIIDGGYSSSNVTDPVLIANNVVYSNGGRGIIIYELTGNHWVVNNTLYKNALDLQIGGCGFSRGCDQELAMDDTSNNKNVNNIARSWDTQHPFGGCCGASNNRLDHNLSFGSGSNELGFYSPVVSLNSGDPRFVNPPAVSDSVPSQPGQGWFNNALDPRQLGNGLQVQTGSPAINAGIDPSTLTTNGTLQQQLRQVVGVDINGAARTGAYDLGAYETGGTAANTPTTVAAATRTNTPATSAQTLTPTPPVTFGTPIRIDSASNVSTVDSSGNRWSADTNFVAGSTVDRGAIAIGNTNDPFIYRTERYGMTGYSVPIANGNYTVRLHFAETYAGVTAPGQRVFDVTAEGATVLPALDVFAQAGGRNIALVRTFTVSVTDGQLNIGFIPHAENPEINGLEILPPLTTPTITPNVRPSPSPTCTCQCP